MRTALNPTSPEPFVRPPPPADRGTCRYCSPPCRHQKTTYTLWYSHTVGMRWEVAAARIAQKPPRRIKGCSKHPQQQGKRGQPPPPHATPPLPPWPWPASLSSASR